MQAVAATATNPAAHTERQAVAAQTGQPAAIAEAAWKGIVPALDVLETALSESAWLAGADFTVADLNVAGALYRGLFMDLTRWPHVQAWLQRCWARPAAKHARSMRE